MKNWNIGILFFSLGVLGQGDLSLQIDRVLADDFQTPYSTVQKNLHQLVKDFPKSTKLFELGISDSGEPILGIAIGDFSRDLSKSGSNTPIKSLVVATHHGNEVGSTAVAQAFATSLAEKPILGQTVYVIPVLNISGFNTRRREEQALGRFFDPNRDYPGPCKSGSRQTLKSTQALARFLETEEIVASATLHTFYPAVVYPWGVAREQASTLYEDLFQQLSRLATQESGYPNGNASDVIYPVSGTFEDYAFWKHGVWSLLFELGRSHSPPADEIQEMVKANVPGLRKMFENVPRDRAANHEFNGRCDSFSILLDRHDE